MKRLLKLTYFMTFVFSSTLFAGTQAIMQDVDPQTKQTSSMSISVEANLVRFEHDDEDGSQMIFDSLKKEMIIIDHENKSFMRLNEVTLKIMQDKLQQAKQQMEAQLAKMPAEQREMMKQMMGDKMKLFSEPEQKNIQIIKTNRQAEAAGYQCLITEYLVNNIKTTEFCVTELNQVKDAKPIYDSLVSLSDFFKALYQSMTDSFAMFTDINPFSEIAQLNGFPIKVTNFEAGKITQQSNLQSINNKDFEKDFFTVPKGYTETKMGETGF